MREGGTMDSKCGLANLLKNEPIAEPSINTESVILCLSVCQIVEVFNYGHASFSQSVLVSMNLGLFGRFTVRTFTFPFFCSEL